MNIKSNPEDVDYIKAKCQLSSVYGLVVRKRSCWAKIAFWIKKLLTINIDRATMDHAGRA